MAEMLVLTEGDVKRVLSPRQSNDLVEECFRAMGEGSGENLLTSRIVFHHPPGRCVIKSGYLQRRGALGIKVIRVHPNNPLSHSLPATNCQILVLDGETGVVRALMDGVYVTRIRTGSASAVGARFLARPAARTVAVIGAGVQGRAQLEALAADRTLGAVLVWSRTVERRKTYAQEMATLLDLNINPVASIEEACKQADIIITATWSFSPLVKAEWVQPGTYIAAIGADAPDMQELDPRILQRSKVVVDDLEQCVRMGEINVPVKNGSYRVKQVHGTIGEVVAGLKPGRLSVDEITVFDSTGLGVQDTVAADYAYQQANSLGIGTHVRV